MQEAAIATGITAMVDQGIWPYQSATTIMVPYKAQQTDFFPEDYLVSLYCRLVEQELLDIIFPGMNFTHLNQFITFFNSPAHPLLTCLLHENGQITTTAGIGYITETDGREGARKAGFGFGFFKEHWATQEARTLSWFMLAFWMFDLKIDVLFGTTLKQNGLARNFSQNFGFQLLGDIPKLFFRSGELEDATLMLLEKPVFSPLYEKWREELRQRDGYST